jgi:hypothetical protein
VVNIDQIITTLFGRLRRLPAVSTIKTEDAQVSYLTTREVEVVTGVTFDESTCQIQQATTVVKVVDKLTPQFVVKEVREIPAIYYGP